MFIKIEQMFTPLHTISHKESPHSWQLINILIF